MAKIYIMGCGRSGTTYLLTLMNCFADTYVLIDDAAVPGEDHFGKFASIAGTERNQVIKRASNAYDFVAAIPVDIELLYLVRHPLDVLTSTLTYRGKVYSNYIDADRWLLEAEALKWTVESNRSRNLIVKYEHLISAPDFMQQEIADFFGLDRKMPFSEHHRAFNASKDISETLNGVRPPDPSSIGRWKSPQARERVAAAWQSIQPLGKWFCQQFDYDTSEINAVLGEAVAGHGND